MNIRNVPGFFRENGRSELAISVEAHLKTQKDNGIEDKLETEALLGFLVEGNLTPPTSEEIVLSPQFAYLKALAVEIHKLEEPSFVIELDETDVVAGTLI
jgi:hypothetical protein